MAWLRVNDDGSDIILENKFLRKFPVEEKIELMLRVIARDALHRFIRKPADAFELVFEEESGIYCYFQLDKIGLSI